LMMLANPTAIGARPAIQRNGDPDPALAKIQKPKPIMPIEIRYAIALFMMRM
jgi:hypothetical protein